MTKSTNRFELRDLEPEELWDIGVQLLAEHSVKHDNQRRARRLVRQQEKPVEVMPGKWLITANSAMAWAIMSQVRSFFDRSTRNVQVLADKKGRKEDERTAKNELWLLGSSAMVNRRAGFVESNALVFGIETGEMILGQGFNPYLAKQGQFPIEVFAPDPLSSAYARSNYGLTHFISQEFRSVAALRDELHTYLARGSGAGINVPESVSDGGVTDLLEDTRMYTKTHEVRWVEGELVYRRKHFQPRIPVDVGYFGDMPSDLPEEWGRGIVGPVADLLELQQQLIDVFATDAELGQRPLGLLFDGMGKYEIVRLAPGEEYGEGKAPNTALTPIPYAPNHQLLHELAEMIGAQIDFASLPRSVFSGANIQLSGYALDLFNQPIKAKLDDWKKYPELVLASHYEMRLMQVRRFNTPEMAQKFSPDDAELYHRSFNVMATDDTPDQTTSRQNMKWYGLTADDVGESPSVMVSIDPNLPADEAARMQKMQAAVGMTGAFEWSARNVGKLENLDDLLRERDLQFLVQTDPLFQPFYQDYVKSRVLQQDKDMAKAHTAYMRAQEQLQQQEQPQAPQGQGSPETLPPQNDQLVAPPSTDTGGIPPELFFAAMQGRGAGMPQGASALPMSPEEMPMQGDASAALGAGIPPNVAMAQVLMGG